MIHEVLLALLGHAGGLICESEEGFVLSAAAEGFLSEAERRVLEETVAIGFHCKCLSEWAAFVRERHFGALADLPWSALSGAPRAVLGHYAYAVAQRVEAALDDYRDRVVELEGQLLQEPSLPLAHMAAFLEEDRRVLCVLRRLVEHAEDERLGGGPLLDLLQSAAASHMGESGVFGCLWSVAAGAGSVLANQLVGWMVYGRLVDPDGDFFIGRVWHHHPPWQPGSALQGGPVDDFSKDIGGAAAQREWLSLFYLRPEVVPNTILSLDTARKVLFAGKASRVLLRGGRWSAGARGGPDLVAIQDDVDALLGCFGAKSPPCVVERAVERIRARVSEKLRRLVVEEAGLAQHLAALKGFCLLGHGAFYQTLLEAARPLLRRPPPPHAEAELAQGPWATAVAELETALPAGQGAGGASAYGSAFSTVPGTPRQAAARPPAGLFEPRFVPRHFDIQSFADAAPQLRLAGAARVVGSRAELGAAGGPAAGPPGATLPGMIWLAVRQRVEFGFSHAFGLQVHSPPTGTAAAHSEHGCRVALCLQHRWSPDELCGWRHVADAQACETAAADVPGAPQHPVWTALGECLALEVTLRIVPGRGGSSEADVHMALYLCQPGLGDGRRPPREAAADGPTMPVLELASESLTVPSPRGMIHSVRLGYDAASRTLEASFGVDAAGPALAVELDLGAAISLDLGCAYVGLCQLPLGHRHRVVASPTAGTPRANAPGREALDQPVSIVSWRHSMDALPTAGDVASAPPPLGGARRRAQDNKELVMRDAWFSAMELSYDAPWPLPLVITQVSMERYNRLFKLLLAFRHVQLELLRASLPRGELLPWAIRSELSFFVSQVLVYFQQDVIEASFAKLMHSVEASREFGEVLDAHEGFLATLSAQCFLTAQEIHDALMTALQIAALFCWRVGEDASGEPAGGRAARAAERALELRQLQLEFEETVRAVLDMMVAMHQQGANAHLSQLLLRLDYNGYFSGQAGDLAE